MAPSTPTINLQQPGLFIPSEGNRSKRWFIFKQTEKDTLWRLTVSSQDSCHVASKRLHKKKKIQGRVSLVLRREWGTQKRLLYHQNAEQHKYCPSRNGSGEANLENDSLSESSCPRLLLERNDCVVLHGSVFVRG